MANQFLTAKRIAQEALPILSDNLVFPMLVWNDYSETFAKQGDTVQVKRPSVFTAQDFPVGGSITTQDLNQFPVNVTMDQIADVSVEITAREMALDFDNFNDEVLEPAVVSIAEKVNSDGLLLAQDIPFNSGVSGTTPATLAPIADAMRILDVNKTPIPTRSMVWDPFANAELLQLDTLVEMDKSGTNAALRQSAMGNVYNFRNFMSQGIATHTAGAYTALADVTAAITAASNTVNSEGFTVSSAVLTSAAGTSTAVLLKGDLLTIDGVQKVVTVDTAAAIAGVVTALVFPAETADVVAGVVVFADVSAGAHVMNVGFHQKAFAYVTRPLAPAAGVDSFTASFAGLSIRVAIGYDMTTKKQTMSLDTLYGYQTMYHELAVQVLG